MSATDGVLKHAVDALPGPVMRRQARRAELLGRAPPLDPGLLPAGIELTPGRDHARYAGRAAILAAFFALAALPVWFEDGQLPAFRALAGIPCAVCLWYAVDFFSLSRTLPRRMRLGVSADGIEIETERGIERRPLTEFEGVAIRRRVLSRGLPERHLRRRTLAEIRDRVYEPRTLYWIELTDSDPRGSVPLWVSTVHDAFGRSGVLRTARGFAAALGLPLISTGGIDPAETGRADALPGLAAAPVEVRAMAAREAVDPRATVRETARRTGTGRPAAPSAPGAVLFTPLFYAFPVLMAGGAFGMLRIIVLEPALGPLWAVVAELPLMLAACAGAAAFVVGLWRVPPRAGARLWMGGGALVLLLAAEAALGHLLFERSLAETLARQTSLPGLLGLAGQVVFGLIPALFLLIPRR